MPVPKVRPRYAAKPLRISHGSRPKSGSATVLQLSDLHLLAKTPLDGDRGHGSFLCDLERALETEGTQFDLVVVTGDVIDASEYLPSKWSRAMAKALEVVERVCKAVDVDPTERLLVIPGNHDLRWRGLVPLPGFRRLFDKAFGKSFVHSYYPELGILAGCFDSNIPVRLWGLLDSAKGLAPVGQCDFLLDDLRNLPGEHRAGAEAAFRLALIHHHLMPIPADDYAAETKLVGAPSQMLLRNAGGFLQRLLQDDYRLVLHGHLHSHGYWLPQTFLKDDEPARWLELISCAWAGVAGPNNVRTYNVVEIQRDGPTRTRRVEFQANEAMARTIPQPMAGYNLTRTRAWDLRPKRAGAVVCDLDFQRWDVLLPSGDVILSRLFQGLRGDGGTVAEMEVFVAAAALTDVRFSAKRLGDRPSEIPFEPFVKADAGSGIPEVGYRLKFDPPLLAGEGGRIDVLLHIVIFGACSTSLEDQAHAGLIEGATRGKEEIRFEAQRACGRAVLNVRFFPTSGDAAPARLDLKAYDPQMQRAIHEAGSDHLFWDYWSADREPTEGLGIASTPEAVLSVYKPQIGYGYGLEWELPKAEPCREPASLAHQRRLVLALDEPAAMQAVDDFLGAITQFVRTPPEGARPLTRWDDDSLGVYLFAFDPASHTLKRVRHQSYRNDRFPTEIAYGRDLIGTVFRLWTFGASFDREEGKVDLIFEKMPQDIQCLYAWPLWRAEWAPAATSDVTASPGPPLASPPEPIDYAPVGVLALASCRNQSGLAHHVRINKETHRLGAEAAFRWRTCQIAAGWTT